MITTLNKIRSHEPCADGWQRLLRHLGKTQADDEPLPLETILESNGLIDALWCLRAVEGRDREIRLYAVWCARQLQHLMTDRRSVAALDVAERYARGQASAEELEAARKAAAAASWAAEASWWAAASWATAKAAKAAEAAAASAVAKFVLAAAAGPAAAASWAAEAKDAAREAQAAELRRVCRKIEAGRDPYPEEEGR